MMIAPVMQYFMTSTVGECVATRLGGRSITEQRFRDLASFRGGLLLRDDCYPIYTGPFWRVVDQRVPRNLG